MTFKHTKFEDSPTMRALEKVAKDKGLVKPETLQKKASVAKKANYAPTDNLMENILKLCAGLRDAGLVKEAAEIETNYLNYKRAQTLYETSKEKGEDLVQSAHPKGSHKLEGVDGEEATFEDIIDQHLKIMKAIEKKPTGKLSEAKAKDIIKAVKMALAQAATIDDVKNITRQIKEKVNQINELASPELTIGMGMFVNSINSKMDNPTVYNLTEAKGVLARLYKRLDPSFISGATWGAGGLSDYTWGRVKPLFSLINNLLSQAIDKRRSFDESEQSKLEGRPDPNAPPPPPKADPAADMVRKINGLAAQFDAVANQIASDDPKDTEALEGTKKWLRDKAGALRGLASQFQNETDKEAVTNVYQATLNKYQAALAKTQQDWA